MSETVTVLPARIYADMVGKQFADGGRGPDVYDCWGVLQEVLRRMGQYPTDYPSRPDLLLRIVSDEWEQIRPDKLLPGDGILLQSINHRYQWHIGVAVDSWNMLHAREGVGVCVERIQSPAHQRRLLGFYRYRGRG
jgi:NlpC/P60 family